MVRNKGFVFTLDAIAATTLLISIFSLLFIFNLENVSPYKRFERVNLFAKDSLEVISQIKVGSLIDDIPALKEQYLAGKITDNSTSVIEVIGTFWSEGNTETAESISKEVLQKIMPNELNYKLAVDGADIYSTSSQISDESEVTQSSKIVSGFQSGKTTKGYVSRAFLEKIKSKTFSSYLYFGGFVGQGNITLNMNDIPSGATVSSIFMEMSFGSDFRFYINGNFCEEIKNNGDEVSVVRKDIDETCNSLILPGVENVFDLNFTNPDISKNYVSGGFIRVDYITDLASQPAESSLKYNFAGITGLINIFDSFYVPGELESMNVHLVFRNDFTTFLNLGEETVVEATGKEDLQTVDVPDSVLSSILNYKDLSNNNIPLRLGIDIPEIEGTADVILITDLSGSMGFASGGTVDCPATTRIELARCLDKIFIDKILSVPGNRISLVGYDGAGACIKSETSLSSDASYLKSRIDSYSASGSTCISCSINKAYDTLNRESNPERQRFVVVMTDGLVNIIPRNNVNGWQPCGAPADLKYQCGDMVSEIGKDQTIASACRVNNDLNAVVHAIGFGPIATCEFSSDMLEEVAECGDGIFAASSSPDELQDIYERIAQEIIKQNYERQKVTLTKDVRNMTLSSESYIEFAFKPVELEPVFGGVSINIETNTFPTCQGTFFIPDGFRVDRIHVTSYSWDYWTDNVRFRESATSSWEQVFRLSDFGDDYTVLGDPFNVEIPADLVKSGSENQVDVSTGLSTQPNPVCSEDNKVIYTATFNAITPFSPVLPKAEGNWFRVYFNRGDFDCTPEGSAEVAVGSPTDSNVLDVSSIDLTNSVHYAFAELLKKLNLKTTSCSGPLGSSTNPIDIEIIPELKFETSLISNVPSLWGPSKFSLIAWS